MITSCNELCVVCVCVCVWERGERDERFVHAFWSPGESRNKVATVSVARGDRKYLLEMHTCIEYLQRV